MSSLAILVLARDATHSYAAAGAAVGAYALSSAFSPADALLVPVVCIAGTVAFVRSPLARDREDRSLSPCQYALVGRAVTPGSETEAFTWVTAALVAGIAAGSAAGGVVIGSGGVSAPFVLSCLVTALAALLATGQRRRAEQHA